MTLDETRAFLRDLNALVDEVAAFPRPVIAALNGAAFGGGLELALACDLRLAAPRGPSWGCPRCGWASSRARAAPSGCPGCAGWRVAKELILTGRRIDAARARELGLVNAVVAPAATCGRRR